MRKRFVAAIAALIAASVFLSCATAPDWISRPPPPDSVNTWFVGSASGKDEAAAVNDATANLIAGIMQYMGIRVTVNTSAMAKASLESYTAEITQTVTMQSENRLAGLIHLDIARLGDLLYRNDDFQGDLLGTQGAGLRSTKRTRPAIQASDLRMINHILTAVNFYF